MRTYIHCLQGTHSAPLRDITLSLRLSYACCLHADTTKLYTKLERCYREKESSSTAFTRKTLHHAQIVGSITGANILSKRSENLLLLIKKIRVFTLTLATWSNMLSVVLFSNLAWSKSSILISQEPTTCSDGVTISRVKIPTSLDDRMTESFSNCRGEVCSAGNRTSGSWGGKIVKTLSA